MKENCSEKGSLINNDWSSFGERTIAKPTWDKSVIILLQVSNLIFFIKRQLNRSKNDSIRST